MWPIIHRLLGRKQRNASSPKMLQNPFLHMTRDNRNRRAIRAASKSVKNSIRPLPNQDLARLHKEK